ncbi:MAG: glycosyltransferase [Hylemonella sp.]|nr:glycosyltransferase [Hylemonella sp.]
MKWETPVSGRPEIRPLLLKTLSHLIRERGFGTLILKAYRLLRREGLPAVRRRLALIRANYQEWIKAYDTLTDVDRRQMREHISRFEHKPLISILMPTFNGDPHWLTLAVASVQRQIYPHWELCIADDASSDARVRILLADLVYSDARIRVTHRSVNGHISAATNTALEMAQGEFITLLDQDDVLAEHALYLVASTINVNPSVNLIYSDEDKIDIKGRRFDPYFKPDWNPELIRCQNLVSHLGVYRSKLVRALGGFREGYEGAQDWDLALRVAEQSFDGDRIFHIPHVLYHWRTHPGSTSIDIKVKGYAIAAAQRAVQDHLARCQVSAEVLPHPVLPGQHRVRYAIVEPLPLVSIIIPTRNGRALLDRCLTTLEEITDYKNYEVIVVDNQSDDPATLELLTEQSANGKIRVLRFDAPFNYSAINNAAVLQSRGDVLCFLNNDVEIVDSHWLTELVSHAVRLGNGAVGARLFYPGGRIQHAGVILGMGRVAAHIYAGYEPSECGMGGRAVHVQNLSVVTAACLVVTRHAFDHAGGFDEVNLPVAFNDVDFCLRLLMHGYRNIWTPYSTLIHHESATRGLDDTPEKQKRFVREFGFMRERWSDLLSYDPAYNPNLSLDFSYPLPAFPPRAERPWRS